MRPYNLPPRDAPTFTTIKASLSSLFLGFAVSALLLYTLYVIDVPTHETASISPAIIDSDKIRLITYQPNISQPEKTPVDLRIFSSKQIFIHSQHYPYVSLYTVGGHANTTSYFFWRNTIAPSVTYREKLPRFNDGMTTLAAYRHPHWRGNILEAGLIVTGDPDQIPLILKKIDFMVPSFRSHLDAIIGEWLMDGGWNHRSINFNNGGKDNKIISISQATGIWLILSFCFFASYLLYRRVREKTWKPLGSATLPTLLIIIGFPWLTADIIWQRELLQRLGETYQTFYGKNAEQRLLSMKDQHIYKYARHLLTNVFPSTQERVFIFASESQDYTRLKLHFHLIPINVFSVATWPEPSKLRTGDMLVFLDDIAKLEIDSNYRILKLPNGHTITASLVDRNQLGLTFMVQRTEFDNACKSTYPLFSHLPFGADRHYACDTESEAMLTELEIPRGTSFSLSAPTIRLEAPVNIARGANLTIKSTPSVEAGPSEDDSL